MRFTRSRAWAGVAVLAAATALPLLNASPAAALGTPAGVAEIRNTNGVALLNGGDSDDTFTLRLPANASCGGDSNNSGYRVQSYIVPGSVQPNTLQFDLGGPIPQGVGANFSQAMYDTDGTPYVNAQTAPQTVANGPGQVINIPNFNYAIWAPGDIAPGVYNIGIACTLGPASATQMKEFWNTKITVTANPGGADPADINWVYGAASEQPTIALTPVQQGIQVAITPGASIPPDTSYTLSATTSTPGAVPGTVTGSAALSQTIPNLTAGATYTVTAVANNGVGPSPAATAAPVTVPNLPGVTGLTFTNDGPGATTGVLSWTAPTGPTPDSYLCSVLPAGPIVNCGAGTTATVTGATVGTAYSFTVTPQHAAAVGVADAASTSGSFESSEILIQELEVERPVGKLVLTQRCGVWGDLPAWPASAVAPEAGLVAATVDTTGTAPFLGPNGTGGQDTANFGEYPYPVDGTEVPNPEYPTYCGIQLGTAKLLTSGPGAGQLFFATGQIKQVTGVDTRDTDEGWDIVGDVSDFVHTVNATKTFSGNQLGWDPEENGVTAPYTDGAGNTYTQIVEAGAIVEPNIGGFASGAKTLGKAITLDDTAPTLTGGLGISKWDARLKLLIPVYIDAGVYRATLSLTVA